MARERVKLTAEQVVQMHEYCITAADVRRSTSRNLYIPKSLEPVCEHPEHGWCAHRSPSEVELAGINAILSDVKDASKIPDTGIIAARVTAPKRAKTPKVTHKTKRYFCLNCNLYHLEGDPEWATQSKLKLKTVGPGYAKHMAFKRGRGRPKAKK